MKTQIFRLEAYDDVNSIRDKLSWAKATRILLAFPRHRPPKFSRLDLVLIQRAADHTGGLLGLVTRDAAIKQLASELAIPVFPSILAAERLSWRTKSRQRLQILSLRKPPYSIGKLQKHIRQPKGNLPTLARIILFTFGAAGFLALVLLFVPSARIEITLPRETQSIDLIVYPEIGSDLVVPSGRIPATIIKTTVEGQMEAAATGIATIPVGTASSQLTLTNLTDQPITIPAGTVFSAPGNPPTRFESRIPVTIDGGFEQTGQVTIHALQPGTGGNAAANSITLVDGDLGYFVKVTNLEDASGGRDRVGLIASESDYTRLFDALVTSLLEDAGREFVAEYGNDLVLFSETLRVDKVESEIRQPETNSPADRVKLSLKIVVSCLAVSRADLISMAAPAMDAAHSGEKTVLPGSYAFSSPTRLTSTTDNREPWSIQVSRSMVQAVSLGELLTSLQGKHVQGAGKMVQDSLNLSQPPEIKVSPNWWPRLPSIPFRIEVAFH